MTVVYKVNLPCPTACPRPVCVGNLTLWEQTLDMCLHLNALCAAGRFAHLSGDRAV